MVHLRRARAVLLYGESLVSRVVSRATRRQRASCARAMRWGQGLAVPDPRVPVIAPTGRCLIPRVPAIAPLGRCLIPRVPAIASLERCIIPRVPAIAPSGRWIIPRVPAITPTGRWIIPRDRSPAPSGRSLIPRVPAIAPLGRCLIPRVPAFAPLGRCIALTDRATGPTDRSVGPRERCRSETSAWGSPWGPGATREDGRPPREGDGHAPLRPCEDGLHLPVGHPSLRAGQQDEAGAPGQSPNSSPWYCGVAASSAGRADRFPAP